mgnify:CR=1 FL=1
MHIFGCASRMLVKTAVRREGAILPTKRVHLVSCCSIVDETAEDKEEAEVCSEGVPTNYQLLREAMVAWSYRRWLGGEYSGK